MGEASPALLGEEGRAKLGIKARFPHFRERVQEEVFKCPKGMNLFFCKAFHILTCNNPFLKLSNRLLTDGLDEEEALRLLIKNY